MARKRYWVQAGGTVECGLSSDYSYYYYDGGGGAHYEDDYDSEDDNDGRPPNCGRRKSVGLSLQWRKEQVFVVHKMLKESKQFSSSSFVVVVG